MMMMMMMMMMALKRVLADKSPLFSNKALNHFPNPWSSLYLFIPLAVF